MDEYIDNNVIKYVNR